MHGAEQKFWSSTYHAQIRPRQICTRTELSASVPANIIRNNQLSVSAEKFSIGVSLIMYMYMLKCIANIDEVVEVVIVLSVSVRFRLKIIYKISNVKYC